MLNFNKDTLKSQLSTLSHRARIVFGASCCERMLPNYCKFQKIEKWGNTQFMEQLLEKVWQNCIDIQLTQNEVELLIEKCYKFIPDEDDFESIYTSFAIDAGSAMCSLLEICVDDNLENLISIAELSINSVDLFVQEEDNMDSQDLMLEEKILSNPLMQNELKNQNDDIETLSTVKIFDESFINAFRSKVRGKCNLVM